MSAGAASTRMQWMDLLRGTAVVLIVFMHATVGSGSGWVGTMNLALEPFRVPMLLVISGTLLHRSLAKPLPVYVSGKLRRIAWPWAVWMVPMIVLWWDTFSTGSLVGFLLTYTHLWYLTVLLVAYGAAPFIRAARVPWWAAAAALVLVAWATDGVSELVSTYAWHCAFFFAGAALAPLLGRWVGVGWLPVVAAGAVAAAGAALHLVREEGVLHRPDQMAASLAGVMVLVWLAARTRQGKGLIGALEWFGRRSIVPYVAHLPVLTVLREFVDVTTLAGGLVAFAAALGVCAVLTWAEPPTRWLYEAPVRIGRA